MLGIIIQTTRLFRAVGRILGEPEGRGLAVLALVQLLGGVIFYTTVEGWRWLDALYFCVCTLTTVGYGDLAPATDAGKIFTMLYILTGVGLIVALLTLISDSLRHPGGTRPPA